MWASPELTRAIPNLGPYFEAAGLTDEEATTFLRLCVGSTVIPRYGDVLTDNRVLAGTFADRMELHRLGYSSDYPKESRTPRRIEAALIRNLGGSTENLASVEAPQHGPEQAAVATAGQQRRLHLLHPDIIGRMGFDGIVISDTADPDLMEMQQWTKTDSLPTVEQFILGGVRGAGQQQLTYGYPTADFAGTSEARASLNLHNTFRPIGNGLIHNSMVAGYCVVSPTFPIHLENGLDPLVRLHEQMGRPVNYDTAEAGSLPLLSPGMYSLPTEEGGAVVTDHARKDAIFFNPEVPMLHYPKADNTPSGKTVAEAFEERNAAIKARLDRLGNTLAETDFDQHDFSEMPEAGRLYNAATDWCERVGDSIERTRQNIQALPSEIADRPLTISQFLHIESGFTVNSLMVVANVRRLALITGEEALARKLERQIRQELPSAVGSAEFLPLDVVVCAQGLSSLIALRRIAQTKGL